MTTLETFTDEHGDSWPTACTCGGQLGTTCPVCNPGMTYAEAVRHRQSVVCPMPRCRAQVGHPCRSPNGWGVGTHKARIWLADGEPPKQPKARKHRLTDAQAQRIEIAAEYGQFYAAGQYANFGGDATERAVADALLRNGLVEQASADEYGERKLVLTEAGWRAYWHDPKVIRRVPDERHADTCPCRANEA